MLKTVDDLFFLRQFLQNEVYWTDEPPRYPLVVLLHDARAPDLPSDEETLLHNLLTKGIKFAIDQVKVYNIAFPDTDILPEELTAPHYLSFGADFAAIGLHGLSELHRVYSLGRREYMRTHTLTELHADAQKKKVLWQALQQMFAHRLSNG